MSSNLPPEPPILRSRQRETQATHGGHELSGEIPWAATPWINSEDVVDRRCQCWPSERDVCEAGTIGRRGGVGWNADMARLSH